MTCRPPTVPPSSAAPARRRSVSRYAISPDGEVLARGNHIMAGYWNQADATADAIRPADDAPDGPSWFRTGDGGHLDADQYVTISDRKKDVIISGGENVSSIEVEDAIFSHPDVAEVAVIGVPDEKWGEMVMALVVTAAGSTLTESDLIAFTKTKLAGYKCPKAVEFRDALAAHGHGQAAEVQVARAVLGRSDKAGQLIAAVRRPRSACDVADKFHVLAP